MSEQPELQYGNATCQDGHPLWVIEENYAYCKLDLELGSLVASVLGPTVIWAWRFTRPSEERLHNWCHWSGVRAAWPNAIPNGYYSRPTFRTKAEMLAFIKDDIAAHAEAPTLAPGPTYAEYLAAVAQ